MVAHPCVCVWQALAIRSGRWHAAAAFAHAVGMAALVQARRVLTSSGGGAVDGDIRIRPLRTLDGKSWRVLGYTSRSSEQLREFAEACDPRRSLPSNNCWTFAAKLARYAILE